MPAFATTPVDAPASVDARVAYALALYPILDPLARYRMVRANGNQRLVDAHHAYWPDERYPEGIQAIPLVSASVRESATLRTPSVSAISASRITRWS